MHQKRACCIQPVCVCWFNLSLDLHQDFSSSNPRRKRDEEPAAKVDRIQYVPSTPDLPLCAQFHPLPCFNPPPLLAYLPQPCHQLSSNVLLCTARVHFPTASLVGMCVHQQHRPIGLDCKSHCIILFWMVFGKSTLFPVQYRWSMHGHGSWKSLLMLS